MDGYHFQMKTIRVFFLDWYDWILRGSTEDNIFLWILKKHYNVVIDSQNPDILFYSLKDNKHLKYKNCLKIYVNSEPLAYNNLEMYNPDLRHVISIKDADHIITSYKSNIDKNYYMPIFLLWLYHHVFVTKKVVSLESLTHERSISRKDNFCVFLHNNNVPVRRTSVYNQLSKYKFIHTGNVLKIPEGSINKIIGITSFKFSFAMQNHFYKENFENYDVPGLIDEKIIESLIAGTVPLYYGNDLVGEYLNKNAVIDYHEFNSDHDFVERIIEVDSDDNLYKKIATQPIVENLSKLKLDELEQHILKIINL